MIDRPSLPAILSIGLNSFLELVRSRALLGFFAFGIFAMLGTLPLGEMSLHNESRVATNGTYFITTVIVLLVSVYGALSSFFSDLERRVIYTLLSKPIDRLDYLLGKFFGSLFVGLLSVVCLSAVSIGLIVGVGGDANTTTLSVFLCLGLQIPIISGLALFAAVRTSPIVASLGTFGLYSLGMSISQIERASAFFKTDFPFVALVLEGVALVAPDFESLSLAKELTYGTEMTAQYFISASLYSFVYSIMMLISALVLFKGREIQ